MTVVRQALEALSADELRRVSLADRVLRHRDFDRETEASALYEELCVLTSAQLCTVAIGDGFDRVWAENTPRQQLVAAIIEGRLP